MIQPHTIDGPFFCSVVCVVWVLTIPGPLGRLPCRYFALPNVLEGLFSLTSRIFGVEIKEAPKDATSVWNADVQFFHVNDAQSGEHIASFYLDPYARPADKRGGAWMDVCVGKSSVLDRIPVAYLTCNGSPPVRSSSGTRASQASTAWSCMTMFAAPAPATDADGLCDGEQRRRATPLPPSHPLPHHCHPRVL
jgi:hypothetical protein